MRLPKLKIAALLAFSSLMISIPALAQGDDDNNRNEDRKFYSDQVTTTTDDVVLKSDFPRKFHSDEVTGKPAGNSQEKDLPSRKFHSDEVVVVPFEERPAQFKSTDLSSTTTLQANALQVYPNPATVDFTVQVNQNELQEATLMITDMLGKIVHQQKLENTTGSLSTKVNTAGMAEGVYLVTIVTATDQQTQRLVIR